MGCTDSRSLTALARVERGDWWRDGLIRRETRRVSPIRLWCPVKPRGTRLASLSVDCGFSQRLEHFVGETGTVLVAGGHRGDPEHHLVGVHLLEVDVRR